MFEIKVLTQKGPKSLDMLIEILSQGSWAMKQLVQTRLLLPEKDAVLPCMIGDCSSYWKLRICHAKVKCLFQLFIYMEEEHFLKNLLSFCREVMGLSCLPLNLGAHLTVCPGPTPASTGWTCHLMKAFYSCAVS